jgi:hypothetical protein
MAGHPPEFYEEQFPPQVEGDDSIGAYIYELDPDLLLKIGARAKLEVFDSYNEASFCGVCFGSEDGSVIKDPIKVLLDFGYANYLYLGASSFTRRKLIRAKSLSLLYSYPGCPILKSLAKFGLRVTSDVDNRWAFYKKLKTASGTYEREFWTTMLSVDFSLLLDVPIHLDSRLMMEKKFGILMDHQLKIEAYLDAKNDLSPIDLPLIPNLAGPIRTNHYDTHVGVLSIKHSRYVEVDNSIQFKKGNPP